MGLFKHTRALRAALVACGLAYFGAVGTGQAAPWQFDPALARAGEPAEPFHLWTSRVIPGRPRRQMAIGRLQARRRTRAACAVRRRPRELRLGRSLAASRHRRQRPPARGPRPARRNQPRHQSGDPPDERSGPVRPGGRLELAAGHFLSRRRRLRGLRDCEIRRAADGRHSRGGFADRGAGRHLARRRPCGGRRPPRRPLADPRQPPHGDGRGHGFPQLSPAVRDRSDRRHEIFRRAAAGERLRSRHRPPPRHLAGAAGQIAAGY